MSYDPECYDLAKHYLPWLVGEQFRVSLAEAITKAVEAWIASERETVALLRAAQRKCQTAFSTSSENTFSPSLNCLRP